MGSRPISIAAVIVLLAGPGVFPGADIGVFAETQATQAAAQAPATQPASQPRITCQSTFGERQHCPADTSAGVALVKSNGTAPCLLGKTWGYDDTGIWVSDGCAGEFVVGQTTGVQRTTKAPEYVPNAGFLLYDGEQGQIYFRLFSYVRYLDKVFTR